MIRRATPRTAMHRPPARGSSAASTGCHRSGGERRIDEGQVERAVRLPRQPRQCIALHAPPLRPRPPGAWRFLQRIGQGRVAFDQHAPGTRRARPLPAPARRCPANRSSTRAPGKTGCSQLNRVSRTRSALGRRPGLAGTDSRVPRQRPPMMRMLPDRRACGGSGFIRAAGGRCYHVRILRHPRRNGQFFPSQETRTGPETPSATDSTRHYSVEELAAAFPAPAARPATAEDEPVVAADEPTRSRTCSADARID